MISNAKVVSLWSNGKSGKSGTMRTDGVKLYSYALQIGFTGEDRLKYVYNYTSHDDIDWLGNKVKGYPISRTTSHHVGLARRIAYSVPPKEV